MRIIIEKSLHRLRLLDGDDLLFHCRVALGQRPVGAKEMAGDGRTPEGVYRICLVKEHGKYGRSLGIDYPNPSDAQRARALGRIDEATLQAVSSAHREGRRPPWGSPLGGEIYIHEGGAQSNWTQGCIALESEDMDVVFPLYSKVESVHILP